MAKSEKTTVSFKHRILFMLVALVIISGSVCGLIVWKLGGDGDKTEGNFPIYLKNGISIEQAEAYTGPFWEDGTDRAVEGVWQVTLLNTSQKDIQYMKLVAWGPSGEALGEFELTTLTAGSTIRVLESSAAQLPENWDTCTYTIENLAYLQQERSIYSDIFDLSVADQRLRLENHSQSDIENDIYVYYKVVENQVLMGGITYRVKFAGGLAAGERREEQTQHFDPDTCQIMYLTYQ